MIISEGLIEALGEKDRLSKKIECVREDNFIQMYRHLGDEVAQRKIREANRNRTHCRFLKDDPNACECLPYDIGTARQGQRCPNNPFFRFEEEIYDFQLKEHIVNRAEHIEELIVLDMLPPIDEITPEEFAVAVAVKRFMKMKDLEMQSIAMWGSPDDKEVGK